MQSVLDFVLAHEVLFSTLGIGILDLIFALNPAAAANGILHWVFNFLSGVKPSA